MFLPELFPTLCRLCCLSSRYYSGKTWSVPTGDSMLTVPHRQVQRLDHSLVWRVGLYCTVFGTKSYLYVIFLLCHILSWNFCFQYKMCCCCLWPDYRCSDAYFPVWAISRHLLPFSNWTRILQLTLDCVTTVRESASLPVIPWLRAQSHTV